MTSRQTLLTGLALAITAGVAHAAPVVKPYSKILTRITGDPGSALYTDTIDLNDDAVPDIRVFHEVDLETGQIVPKSVNWVTGLNGATVMGTGSVSIAATPLSPGQLVDPAANYASGNVYLFDFPGQFSLPDVAVGVRIPVGGQNDYAWLGLQRQPVSFSTPRSDQLVIHDYGYETTLNTAVAAQAPEPATLSLLALAAAPLLARRRR